MKGKLSQQSTQPTDSDKNNGKLKKKKFNKKKNKARREFVKEFKERCVSQGYDKIISKPFQSDIILTSLNKPVDLKKLLRSK